MDRYLPLHFHYVLSLGAVYALIAGLYGYMGRITGTTYSGLVGYAHLLLFLIGANLTFFPQHYLGLAGMPRRIVDYADSYAPYNAMSTLGAIISTVASAIYLITVLSTDTTTTVDYALTQDHAQSNHVTDEASAAINEQPLDSQTPSAATYHAFGNLAVA